MRTRNASREVRCRGTTGSALLVALGALALLGCPPGDELAVRRGEDRETFRILGFWRQGAGEYEVTFDQPWPSLSGRAGEAGDPDATVTLQLLEVETYLRAGSRNYAAVWRKAEGASILEGDLSFSDLERLANRSEGGVAYRLVDVECYGENGEVEYLGLWRPEPGQVKVERGLFYLDLASRTQLEAYGPSFRLDEVELCPPPHDGGGEYLALWVEGSGERVLKDVSEWDDTSDALALDGTLHLHDESDDFPGLQRFDHWFHNLDRSLRLYDVEIEGDTPRVGLWRTGSGCDWLWLGGSWEELLAQPAPEPPEPIIDDLVAIPQGGEEVCEPLPPLDLIDLEIVRIVTPAGGSPNHPAHGGHGSGGPEG